MGNKNHKYRNRGNFMISVNGLIINALKSIGAIGEEEVPGGYYQNAALHELNSLCTELNLEDYISECRKEKFVTTTGTVTIGNSDNFDIKEELVPDSIKVVARKVGNRYLRLIKCDKATIYARNRASLPTLYTYGQEYDENEHCMKGVIFTDGGTSATLLVIYNKKLPEYTIDDELWLSDMTVNLIEEGLKYRLAVRFKMPDAPIFEDGFNDYKRLVQNVNGQNNPMTYENLVGGSYLDNYYDCLGGVGF